MLEVIENNLIEIVIALISGLAGYIGLVIKNAYTKYIDTKTKKEIVTATVEYVEQVFKSLKGVEKLNKAKEKAQTWLNEKGIKISDTELEILIESAVNSFNQNLTAVK